MGPEERGEQPPQLLRVPSGCLLELWRGNEQVNLIKAVHLIRGKRVGLGCDCQICVSAPLRRERE
jgi:hypothetical protein